MLKRIVGLALLVISLAIPFAANAQQPPQWVSELRQSLSEEGSESGWKTFTTLRPELEKADPSATETQLIRLGYGFLRQNARPLALEVFRMARVLYPEAWNVWDSLGEAFSYSGLEDSSRMAYERSLELNPENENGRSALLRLDGQILAIERETKVPFGYTPGQQTGIQAPYFGQKPPGIIPEVFAPGIISTANTLEFSCSFSPDGREFYFNREFNVWVSRWEQEGWTAPERAAFNHRGLSHEAHITPDGKRLFFGSARPNPQHPDLNYGIWVMDRDVDGTLGEPRFHGEGMYVTTSANGNLYVTGNAQARGDIVMQSFSDGEYSDMIRIPGAVNTPASEAHPCISPDESVLVYDSQCSASEGGVQDSDMFVSFRQPDGSWGPGVSLGPTVNSIAGQMTASISPDGLYLFYFSNRDIYWVSMQLVYSLNPDRLDE